MTYAASCLQECNDFLAGNILRSSTRYKALDETAIFGSACRHEFPALFFNLKHGERYIFTSVHAFAFQPLLLLASWHTWNPKIGLLCVDD